MTALQQATLCGHVEIVDFLGNLSRGSFTSVHKEDRRTLLHYAAMQSQFAVVEFLVRKGCPVGSEDMFGYTALHYACKTSSTETVWLLLESGANIDSIAKGRELPIHCAAAEGSVAIIKMLQGNGADIEARDNEGNRALCIAASRGRVSVVQAVLDLGSPLHSRHGNESFHDSPICLAAKERHRDVVLLLLSRGDSVFRRDESGWTAVSQAAFHGHPDVLEAILAADPSRIAALDFTDFSPHTIGMSGDRGFTRMIKRVNCQSLLSLSRLKLCLLQSGQQ